MKKLSEEALKHASELNALIYELCSKRTIDDSDIENLKKIRELVFAVINCINVLTTRRL